MPALPFYFIKIRLILFSHLRPNYPSCLFLSGFPIKTPYAFLFFQHTCNMLRPSHVSWSDNQNNKFRTLQVIKPTQHAFLQFLSYSSSQAHYLPQTLSACNLVTRWPTDTQHCSLPQQLFFPLETCLFRIFFPPRALGPQPSTVTCVHLRPSARSHKVSQPMFAPNAH